MYVEMIIIIIIIVSYVYFSREMIDFAIIDWLRCCACRKVRGSRAE
jgi:hypothetical protein